MLFSITSELGCSIEVHKMLFFFNSLLSSTDLPESSPIAIRIQDEWIVHIQMERVNTTITYSGDSRIGGLDNLFPQRKFLFRTRSIVVQQMEHLTLVVYFQWVLVAVCVRNNSCYELSS